MTLPRSADRCQCEGAEGAFTIKGLAERFSGGDTVVQKILLPSLSGGAIEVRRGWEIFRPKRHWNVLKPVRNTNGSN